MVIDTRLCFFSFFAGIGLYALLTYLIPTALDDVHEVTFFMATCWAYTIVSFAFLLTYIYEHILDKNHSITIFPERLNKKKTRKNISEVQLKLAEELHDIMRGHKSDMDYRLEQFDRVYENIEKVKLLN